MKRVAGAVLAALTWVAVSAGCSGAGEDEEVTLRFWAMGREGEVVQQLIPEFERRNPGVRVEVQQIPWTAAHEKLLTSYVGDATPDLTQLGNTWIPEFVALGALEPLDARLRGSAEIAASDYFAGIWDTNLVGGRVYGIPWYVDTRVLFYRSDLLAEAGYDSLPQSWAGWRAAMERIRARMGPGQYPLLLPTNEWNQPVAFALQTGSPLLRDGGRYGGFEDPRFVRAFDFYVGLFRDSLAPALANTEVSNLYQEFAKGNIAMYITGPWNIGEFRDRLPAAVQDRWMTAPLPGPGGPGVSLAGGASFAIFRASPHRAEAWKLIEYLSAPRQQVRFYRLTGDLPAHKLAWREAGLRDDRYARAFWEQLQRVEPTPKVPEWEQIATAITDTGERVVRGREAVDRALARLDREVDQLLEKRRWLLARAERRDTPAEARSPASPGSR
ncbi:sugar ABC transporter substrate-binding protein [soil metagenome]